MSSGSLKDLSKAITANVTDPSLPLPPPLLEALENYLAKHSALDDDHSQRLQDELLAIYNTQIASYPSRLAPFLSILRVLKPAIQSSGRLLQWWERLSANVLQHLVTEKGLALEARETLLGILVWDEDEEDGDASRAEKTETAQAFADSLVDTWIRNSKIALEDNDQQAQFVELHVQQILLSFGRKRPKNLLNTINKFFIKKESRIVALSLLCDFIRHQPPHLHVMLQTPLFDNLLKCLQIDTSTRVISLAMTALVMFLPHIPSSASGYLPALFNIYSRMLFWERERRAADPLTSGEETEKIEVAEAQSSGEASASWVKMTYLLESEDETVPELLHYFTFLYGLYPLNFMSYIRKPHKYLRHANFSGADDLDIEPSEIQQRSEPFRQVHLLHPNFFVLTMESELTDNHRWRNSEAADVVAECMGLYTPGDDSQPRVSRSRGPAEKIDPNPDVPEHALLDNQTLPASRHASWRQTQPINGVILSQPARKSSHTSQSLHSVTDSPTLRPNSTFDSPTIPAQILGHQSLTNESVVSLVLANANNEMPIDVDRFSTGHSPESILRSPSLRPLTMTAADPSLKILYLHREIQLLRNDLHFEQYLKAQHLSHIGQVRRKQIREARVEAETQNLVNSSRQLKSKLEDTKRINLQVKKESEKSKIHSRKWESDLSNKLRGLREDQKKWASEKEDLKRDLNNARDTSDVLRQLVVTTESREHGAKQRVQSVESSLDELERLRAEVEKLTLSLQTYEAGESLAVKARENEEAAQRELKLIQFQLETRDKEALLSQQAFELELRKFRNTNFTEHTTEQEAFSTDVMDRNRTSLTKDILDSAVSASRNRVVEIAKSHNHLLKKYTALQNQHMDLKEQLERHQSGLDEPLLSSGHTISRPYASSTMRTLSKRSNTFSESTSWNLSSPPPTSPPNSPLPVPPVRIDTSHKAHNSSEGRSPISGGAASHFMGAEPFLSMMTTGKGKERESIEEDSLDGHGKVKIKPQSDVRIYGRGGVQNIGKKKESAAKERDNETKKEKKGVGIRGLRGF